MYVNVRRKRWNVIICLMFYSVKVDPGNVINNFLEKEVKQEDGFVYGVRSGIILESYYVDEVLSGCDKIKVWIGCGVDSDTEGGESSVNRNVEIVGDEVPNHLLQLQDTLEND